MNDLLRAILDINHLMVRETDPPVLLEKTCELLQEYVRYPSVWLAIIDENGTILDAYGSGDCPDLAEIRHRNKESMTPCFREALETDGVEMLSGEGLGENGGVVQYAFDAPRGRAVLTVHLPGEGGVEGGEDLLATVAEDLSFALNHIEDEKKKIEAQKAWERALEESQEAENRYRTLFDNLADAIFIHDFQGNIIEVNDAACEHLGYEHSDLIGMNVTDIDVNFEPEDALDMRNHLEDDDGVIIRSEQETADRRHIPVEIHSRIINFEGKEMVLSVARDISARKRTSKEKERLLQAVRAAQEAIIVTSDDGRIIFANQAVRDLFGGSRDELIGQAVWALLASENPREELEDIRQTLSDQSGWEGEIQVEDADGDVFTCYATVTAVRDDQGRAMNYIATANDISEQKKTEAELREAVEELRKTERQVIDQERQRALSQMASGIAHDFNNALSTIRGFTELLLEDAEKRKDDEVLSKYLSVIDSAANNAADTVRRMRKFYRPAEEAELRTLNINTIVDEAVSLTRPKWEQEAQASGKTIHIERELDEVPPVRGNEAELHEMLANIIFNAVDAIEEEGIITIDTHHEDGEVVLDVSDDGQGMETYTRRHCADPFYTTKGEDGTGLGLAVTAGIVRRHEGTMEIESERGGGTTVSVVLPVDQESGSVPTSDTSEESYENGESLRVLVAEDDVAQQELIADMLDVMGHVCDVEPNGERAMERFDSGGYDLVLTDRAMPKMRGDEVARQVRRKRKKMPVIMVTGFGDMMDAAAEHPDCVDLVISKPLSLKKLSSAIEDARAEHGE